MSENKARPATIAKTKTEAVLEAYEQKSVGKV